MWYYIAGIAAAAVMGFVAALISHRRRSIRRERDRRHRWLLAESPERIPFVLKPAAGALQATETNEFSPRIQKLTALVAVDDPPSQGVANGELGRLVIDVEGQEQLLTIPPFSLRTRLLGKRQARYAERMLRRLPAWVLLCPRVHLEAIIKPSNPRGRDAVDWRRWRRRVRWRCVDFLLIDRRSCRPIAALMLARSTDTQASKIGGGRDGIVDEVCAQIGLPLLWLCGIFSEDWPMIRPYVEESILASDAGEVSGEFEPDSTRHISGLFE